MSKKRKLPKAETYWMVRGKWGWQWYTAAKTRSECVRDLKERGGVLMNSRMWSSTDYQVIKCSVVPVEQH